MPSLDDLTDDVLYRVGAVTHGQDGELQLSRTEAFRAAYWATVGALRDAGMTDGRKAHEIALRRCRLVFLRDIGVQQQHAAELLGKSERTAKNDAAAMRKLVESGAMLDVMSQSVQRIPLTPADGVIGGPVTENQHFALPLTAVQSDSR